jgi:hypothetical protein
MIESEKIALENVKKSLDRFRPRWYNKDKIRKERKNKWQWLWIM